ncbi:MAG: RNA polymerase factor sigma-54 [Alphaproteobacteria bacterium]|nr:RNA polymerase factor sigma-54 [Alphaproteobacteria bacterium]
MSSYAQRLNVFQKQSQTQTLSPQMQRTMFLLQLSGEALEEEIMAICEANPLIAERSSLSRNRSNSAALADWTATTPARLNLSDHLKHQLALTRTTPHIRALALRIIEHIEPSGRLNADDWAHLADARGADDALALVQSFEPAGVGARSIIECFALQLDPQSAACPRWQALLDNLHALATEPAHAFARRCGVSETELKTMIAHLRTLDLQPGYGFETADAIEIIPDLRAERSESGEWAVALSWDPTTSIALEPAYRGWHRNPALAGKARSFLQGKHEEARWLKQALRQRGDTLLRVARLAIAFQHRFMSEGTEALIPLTMREIATRLELHESTVSRAVAHKHIETPRGVLPLRSFFSTAVSEAGENAATASAAVRARIEKMIANEVVPGEMSDGAISQALCAEGVEIARRSIAKHRDRLGIVNARERARLASYAPAAE